MSLPVSDRNALARSNKDEVLADQTQYQTCIGALIWLSQRTRPDIAYVSTQLSQYCNEPCVRQWNSTQKVVRYLGGSVEYALTLGGGEPRLQGYADSDYAGDVADRRSTTGHIFTLCGGPVSWASVKQRCVSTSTTESEYIALSEACKQGQWLRALLRELQRTQYLGETLLVPIFSDNQSCIALAKDPIAHSRTKHIDVRYHYIRELVVFNKTTVDYLPTSEMLADFLTKPLAATAFKRCIQSFLGP
jgi:hypothetical protein